MKAYRDLCLAANSADGGGDGDGGESRTKVLADPARRPVSSLRQRHADAAQ